ncbi:hypothetical protein [Tenacibaculum sp. 190130A14a]|uniref:Uncharacterized protein n=1 Tax=Tenacibaculum polynesiense TaxID=3137857 RepID=A0ABP1F298_9FLAO
MNISQEKNGNIVLKNQQNQILGVLPFVCAFKHPRIENAILINTSGNPTDEKNGFTANFAHDKIQLQNTSVPTASEFLHRFNNQIAANGSLEVIQEDTLYTQFLNISDYETMYLFAKAVSNTQSPITYDANNRIAKEEYVLQFTSTTARITLYYYYLYPNQNTLSHILMAGTTTNIAYPLKTYQYINDELTHSYELKTWQRTN